MPIRPPNLDDRRYHDLVDEARRLIPQYCPEWTNLGESDPGMTLVQLFAWMTELTIFRLNRVADKTYIHFLNFIGEERRPARPASVPVTFELRGEGVVEMPSFSRVSTRQREDRPALDFLTVEALTIHDAHVERVMVVRGGARPAVRELPFSLHRGDPSVLAFGSGRGISFFNITPERHGLEAYTPHQYLYIGDDDLRLMNIDPESGRRPGKLRIARPTDNLSLLSFFDWEYPSDKGWRPIEVFTESEEVLGMADQSLVTFLPGLVPLERMGLDRDDFPIPDPIAKERWWIRGTLSYERWLAARMEEDLDITWQDDWGGETRSLNNWEVRGRGRTLEFFLQDCPPIREGWRIRFALIDRNLPAGQNTYLPRYRWSYRRGEIWEEVPEANVRARGTEVEITGPLRDMATDGFNLRAERVEVVFMRGLAQDLELDVHWVRPVEVDLFSGQDARRLEQLPLDEAPWSPFQLAPVLPPTIGQKFFVGSDLFDNRRKAPVLVEIELAFELDGTPIEEPVDAYLLQLTYRAEDNWRVVYSKDKKFTGFTFADFDPDGAKKASRRRVRLIIDPAEQLKGLARHDIGGVETCWLRFELVRANMSKNVEGEGPKPVVPRIHAVRLGADKTLGDGTYDHPIPNPKVAQVDHREHNRRLTRCITRAAGRLGETFPYFPWIDIEESSQSFYLQFDKPLPIGARHAVQFRCRGEAYLPEGAGVEWEILEGQKAGRTNWRRLLTGGAEDDQRGAYNFTQTGELAFALPEIPAQTEAGFWLRARFVLPQELELERMPALPPITHILLNSVDAVNLHAVSDERFSGLGVPDQVIQLNKKPIFVHPQGDDKPVFPRPETFADLEVLVEDKEGERHPWKRAGRDGMLTADKDDGLFEVDSVDATLKFGNGIRGRMLPVGTHNVIVKAYYMVPGARGNIGPGEVRVSERMQDRLKVTNPFAATGGRDAESVDEILRRAPSILTSRDRAVTRQDFEIIAAEASGEVARAACSGKMGPDGTVEVTILPHRREDERVPDPFLAAGLRDHVASYLAQRCLINVEPVVRLASFLPIDISVTLRLRPNANLLVVREAAERWVRTFLDAYAGGLDGEGWPFGGTLYAQDFSRMVARIPEIRHVIDVQIYDMHRETRADAPPGWESGDGLDELALVGHDLFEVRRVRILTEEEGSL